MKLMDLGWFSKIFLFYLFTLFLERGLHIAGAVLEINIQMRLILSSWFSWLQLILGLQAYSTTLPFWFGFWGRVLFCSPSWVGTHWVTQAAGLGVAGVTCLCLPSAVATVLSQHEGINTASSSPDSVSHVLTDTQWVARLSWGRYAGELLQSAAR